MNKKEQQEEAINRFQILTDSREQTPYCYPNSVKVCLPYGDYSVRYEGKDYFDSIVIERKGNISELFAFSGSQRERFVRELEKMKDVKFKYILIEADFLSIVNDQPPGLLPASQVYSTIFSFMVKYGVTPLFFNSYQNSRNALYKIFFYFVKYEILKIGV